MRKLALFDFDGTITIKDSLDAFFRFISTKQTYLFKKYLLTLPYVILYRIGLISAEKAKIKRIRSFFAPYDFEYICKKAAEFSESYLPSIVKESAMNEIRVHLNSGHEVYIVSASLDILLKSWCEENKIGLITNTLQMSNNVCSGIFEQPDCNGEEKVARVRKQFDLSQYEVISAYGDTVNDLPMLSLATNKYYRHFT
jgi:HAD superfamily hydrolase (TIGR01490 family)